METKRISLKVASDMYDWIQEEANKKALSMNAFIILMLEQYRNQEKAFNLSEMISVLQQLQEQGRNTDND